jgi:hypothetical protein
MRHIIIALTLLLATAAHGQGLTDAEIKAYRKAARDYLNPDPKIEMAMMFRCSASPKDLIGLSPDDLRIKCGRWSRSSATTTRSGRFEQYIYAIGPRVVMYVYVEKNAVVSVQTD